MQPQEPLVGLTPAGTASVPVCHHKPFLEQVHLPSWSPENIFSDACNLVIKYVSFSEARSGAIVWDSTCLKQKAYVPCDLAPWGKCQFCSTWGNWVCHNVTQARDSRGTSEHCWLPFPKLDNLINSPLQTGLLGLLIHLPELNDPTSGAPCECRLSVNRSGTEFLKICLCLYSPLRLMDSLL